LYAATKNELQGFRNNLLPSDFNVEVEVVDVEVVNYYTERNSGL
jgi:hypothetical protein